MSTISAFTYNGESDILKLHLETMGPFVDRFYIFEAKTTFSGKSKPLYFSQLRPSKWHRKITYTVINDYYTNDEIDLADTSPNTYGAEHWKNEFLQKEKIKKGLMSLHDDDICIIGDVDEVIESRALSLNMDVVNKIKLRVYAYYLDNRSSEEFYGPIVTKYKNIKDSCLNHLRSTDNVKTDDVMGWHFTSMGGVREVRRKLNDSYTQESYNTPYVQSHLADRVHFGVDYLGRNFTFDTNEKEWPLYLKKNRSRFAHLCKHISKDSLRSSKQEYVSLTENHN